MSRTLCFVIPILFICFIAKAQNRGTQYTGSTNTKQVDYFEKSYALIIGNSEYTNGWTSLPGVKADILAVEKLFTQLGFKTTLAQNLNAVDLEKTIEEFITKYGYDADARILVYYAGHGHTVKSRNNEEKGYLVPIDAPATKGDENNSVFRSKALSMNQIKTYSEDIEVNHALFIFDACFAGTIFTLDRNLKDNLNISKKISNPVRQFITSGSANETVPDKSIFRSYLVEAFKGPGDVNKDGFITGIELGEYLRSSVINSPLSKQTPQYGNIQSPALQNGDFVFQIDESAKIDFTIQAPKKVTHINLINKIEEKKKFGDVCFVNQQRSGQKKITISKINDSKIVQEILMPPNNLSTGPNGIEYPTECIYQLEEGVYEVKVFYAGNGNGPSYGYDINELLMKFSIKIKEGVELKKILLKL